MEASAAQAVWRGYGEAVRGTARPIGAETIPGRQDGGRGLARLAAIKAALIPHSFLQDLLNRVDVVEVVGRYVQLKKGGANFMGLCPFHN